MFTKNRVISVTVCSLLLLSFNLNAASGKTEKESSLLGYQGGNSFYIPV
ncbi:MAG: hypothetical protein LBL16_01970 [Endomicrobium sp.]|jgi:hypothetical protein|nr:hypothetical protein [Endomicrobium sp.]